MLPVLTPQQAVELDRATQARGVPADQLMERAGWAVARACADLTGGVYGRRAVVVTGKGNNGGDGHVAARHLAAWGMRVVVVTLETTEELREPARSNARRLAETSVRLLTFSEGPLIRELSRADVVVDAVFGTGFRGMPEDEWAVAIDSMNASGSPVVAVDIPSGVNGETGAVDGDAVNAELTVTFGAAKTGVVLMPGAVHAGTVRVADVGFPEELIRADTWLTEPADVVEWLPARQPDAHKKAAGVLVVVAGSRRMPGAARLVARAAARTGTGYVVVATPSSAVPVIQAELAEAVFVPLPETHEGTIDADAFEAVMDHLSQAHALAIGPGLSSDPATAGVVRALIKESPVPMVVDADALNAFADQASELADRKTDAVLTPHLGEYARLTGMSAREASADRVAAARRLAATTGAVSLVKGSRSVVAAPHGEVRINATGSSALATAGTGDVLTGTIGAFLARGADAFDAAAGGAYLHGLAGLLAGARAGDGTLAGDVADRLPDAVELLEEQA